MKNQIRVAVALPTNYGEQGIVVSGGGISKTILSRDYKDAKKILIRRTTDDKQSNRNGVSNSE
jgi:hypothetical protein